MKIVVLFVLLVSVNLRADHELTAEICSQFEGVRELEVCKFDGNFQTHIRKIAVSSWGTDFVILEVDSTKQILQIRTGSNDHSLEGEKAWEIEKMIVPLDVELIAKVEKLRELPTKGVAEGIVWQFDTESCEYEVKTAFSSQMVRYLGYPEPGGEVSQSWKAVATQINELISYSEKKVGYSTVK